MIIFGEKILTSFRHQRTAVDVLYLRFIKSIRRLRIVEVLRCRLRHVDVSGYLAISLRDVHVGLIEPIHKTGDESRAEKLPGEPIVESCFGARSGEGGKRKKAEQGGEADHRYSPVQLQPPDPLTAPVVLSVISIIMLVTTGV